MFWVCFLVVVGVAGGGGGGGGAGAGQSQEIVRTFIVLLMREEFQLFLLFFLFFFSFELMAAFAKTSVACALSYGTNGLTLTRLWNLMGFSVQESILPDSVLQRKLFVFHPDVTNAF